jgi:hypothetical protein
MIKKIVLRVSYSQRYAKSGSYEKNDDWRLSVLPIYNFGQQRLNSAAEWSATEGGQVLPHFKHIVSGASTPPCPITAVRRLSVDRPQ